jgi:hypothetical protein
MAMDLENTQLSGLQWLALIFSVVYMSYAEGYKGFHRGFAPRVVIRASYLRDNPRLDHILLAPLFCMGYIYATRRRKIVSMALTTMIVCFVLIARQLPQPWRGIVDAGVLLGLGWGLVSIWIFTLQAFFGKGFDISPETPEASAEESSE